MKPNDWNHEIDIDSNTNNGDKLGRKVYFNIDKKGTPLEMNTAFNMGVLLQQLMMFETGDARIDDDAILYREKNPSTNKFVFITFGDLKIAIINMKRAKGLDGLATKEMQENNE